MTSRNCARRRCEPSRLTPGVRSPRQRTTIVHAVLARRHQLADDRVAGHLAGHQQAAGGLGVGEQQQLALADAADPRWGRTQSRLRRVPPLT